ncbi:MAG TPA: 50S ribosomal protein L22 [Bacteroidota bacterium]|nr:50S ribosomal protein L22 [Bacteroidota bacterium]
MEAQAVNRYIGSSPRKMRLVIDLIRGKSIPEALHILHFSPKHASKVAEKVLRSAVANLQNKDDAGRIEPEDIIVKRAFVDGGMQMKRISPAPMGRAYRIRKRSNHVTIIVAAKEAPVKEEVKAKAAAKPAPKEVKKPAAKGGKKTAPAAETK